jgi:uncharacterized protein (TIGR00375 family)
MNLISDLHLHSKYDVGCSKKMDIENISYFAKIKGIDLVGTGSFTHKTYLNELKKIFSHQNPDEEFYKYKNTFFVPTAEINNVFEQKGKKRKIHNLIILKSFEECDQFLNLIKNFSSPGNDGRLCVRLDLPSTIDYLLEVNKKALFIPAHIWTPWYGLLGSRSGFSSFKEAFLDRLNFIYAYESGLSSDPPMNWSCSFLDDFALVSFSDAHSPQNLGREATIFELEKLNFDSLFESIKNKKIIKTIEFFPQEGKYYATGCRNCKIVFENLELARCPRCNKKLTTGVLARINSLADRKIGYRPKNAPDFFSIVPLKKLIAFSYQISENSNLVNKIYFEMISKFKNEFNILLNEPISNLAKYNKAVALSIKKMRNKKLKIKPGFDGIFGSVSP